MPTKFVLIGEDVKFLLTKKLAKTNITLSSVYTKTTQEIWIQTTCMHYTQNNSLSYLRTLRLRRGNEKLHWIKDSFPLSTKDKNIHILTGTKNLLQKKNAYQGHTAGRTLPHLKKDQKKLHKNNEEEKARERSMK